MHWWHHKEEKEEKHQLYIPPPDDYCVRISIVAKDCCHFRQVSSQIPESSHRKSIASTKCCSSDISRDRTRVPTGGKSPQIWLVIDNLEICRLPPNLAHQSSPPNINNITFLGSIVPCPVGRLLCPGKLPDCYSVSDHRLGTDKNGQSYSKGNFWCYWSNF